MATSQSALRWLLAAGCWERGESWSRPQVPFLSLRLRGSFRRRLFTAIQPHPAVVRLFVP